MQAHEEWSKSPVHLDLKIHVVLETTDLCISNDFAIRGSTRTTGGGTTPGSEALAVADEEHESWAMSWSCKELRAQCWAWLAVAGTARGLQVWRPRWAAAVRRMRELLGFSGAILS